jgi:hypothetical protein
VVALKMQKYDWVKNQQQEFDVQMEVNGRCSLHTLTGTLLFLSFQGFVIYALVVSGGRDVSDKCGSSLWEFMLARLILYFFEGLVFGAVGAIQACILGACRCFSENVLFCLALVFPLVCFVAMHATLVGLGFTISQRAIDDSQCAATLSSVSFTSTPLLALLGYAYVGIDSVLLFLFTCGGLYMGCFSVVMVNWGGREF